MPWDFAEFDIRKKAAIIAMIDTRIADEKKQAAEMRKKKK